MKDHSEATVLVCQLWRGSCYGKVYLLSGTKIIFLPNVCVIYLWLTRPDIRQWDLPRTYVPRLNNPSISCSSAYQVSRSYVVKSRSSRLLRSVALMRHSA